MPRPLQCQLGGPLPDSQYGPHGHIGYTAALNGVSTQKAFAVFVPAAILSTISDLLAGFLQEYVDMRVLLAIMNASMLLFLLFCLATYLLVKAHDNKAAADSKVVIGGGTLALCILGGLVFMAVPAAFYYYWVCAGTCTDGEFQLDKTPCYFGAP